MNSKGAFRLILVGVNLFSIAGALDDSNSEKIRWILGVSGTLGLAAIFLSHKLKL